MYKTRKIVLTIIAAIVLLLCEIAIISRATGINKSIEVVVARENIQQGEIISKNKLSTVKIFNAVKEPIYLSDINELIGKTALRELKKGEIVLKEMTHAAPIEQKKEDENTRYFSLELKPDQANSWNITKGQLIDILFVPEPKIREQPSVLIDGEKTDIETGIEQSMSKAINIEKNGDVLRLKSITVHSIFDESGKDVSSISSKTSMPRYICLKVKKGEDVFLAAAKKGGTLHISVLPTEH